MAITFRPLSNRVLIARSPTEEKTPSGIIIPGNAQDKPSEGVVKAVGPGRVDDNGRLHEVRLKTGDRVLFGTGDDLWLFTRGRSTPYLLNPPGGALPRHDVRAVAFVDDTHVAAVLSTLLYRFEVVVPSADTGVPDVLELDAAELRRVLHADDPRPAARPAR